MKKITLLLTLCFLLLTLVVRAQTPPNAFNYSAVARNTTGKPIATTTIGIQITILKTSPSGISQYSENHFVSTDAYGLFNLIIGTGSIQSGSMASIDWSNDNYYLKVGLDAAGGKNFVTMGTTQLLSVPYALFAKNAGSVSNSKDKDTSSTNELQTLSIRKDTIFLTNGAFVKLPTYKDKDTSSTNELQTLSIKRDSIQISNGNKVKLPNIYGFTHYIGEVFGGGVVFHLWKDTLGIEHGLIVDKTSLSTSQCFSNVLNLIGSSAQSLWDGVSNCNAIVGQSGHTSSAAALCLNSTNGGQSDWYLPSIDELRLLWQNSFNVNKSLSSTGSATACDYMSSTEISADRNVALNFLTGGFVNGYKSVNGNNINVRAVRAF